jgi:putative transposase
LDVGLKVFYANSDGETVEIPQYYRKAEKRLSRLNRKKSKKFRKGQPQSNQKCWTWKKVVQNLIL